MFYRHSYTGIIASLYWIVTWRLARGEHYQNQCWDIVSWTLRNKLQSNFNRNSYIFIQENVFGNVVWKMAAILSRPQCVKGMVMSATRPQYLFITTMFLGHGSQVQSGNLVNTIYEKRYLPLKAQYWSRIFTAPQMAIAAAAVGGIE